MNDEHRGEPLYVDVERLMADRSRNEAIGLAVDLIGVIWSPTKTAFVFDEEALAAQLAAKLPARGYTADLLRRNREAVASFFIALPDGRWVPSPEYFSLNDGNAEQSDSCAGSSVRACVRNSQLTSIERAPL
jgi:hypothetical protein